MRNPAHPGFLSRDDVAALGYTLAETAKAMGIPYGRLRGITTGRSAITPDIAIRLEQGIGTAAGTWLRMQSAYALAQARLRGTTPKGQEAGSQEVA